ncbi:MAG: CAT RNA binding domain-containing protein [Mediterraneibacter gnavus]
MQVVKVLNNSLVLAVNENGEEVILMGKGIGYKKSIGEKIVSSQIEKIFELKDKKLKEI